MTIITMKMMPAVVARVTRVMARVKRVTRVTILTKLIPYNKEVAPAVALTTHSLCQEEGFFSVNDFHYLRDKSFDEH